jgi:hypothetical protein
MANMIRKLSYRTIFGCQPSIPQKQINVFTMIGKARGVRSGESSYGPWSALVGQFEATTLIADGDVVAGEVFVGPQAFLPEPIHGMLVSQLRDTEVEEVEFAMIVAIKPSKTATGYEYVAIPIVEAKDSGSLNHLRDKLLSALPSPESAVKAKSGKAK